MSAANLLLALLPLLAPQDPTDAVQRAVRVRPHPRQLAWQRREFLAFVHFGPNTFTGREWGTGFEDPAVFAPTELDARQWVEVARSAGMRGFVLTAKHHDGFCLWPSRYTEHDVASSPWRGGGGDVVRELSDACREAGLAFGFYLSPADLFQIESEGGLYGNGSAPSPRTIPREVPGHPLPADTPRFEFVVDDYNEYFLNQLHELLTGYGPVTEVWLDGAHPKRKGGQQYDHAAWYELVRTLAPDAVIAIKGPDVRWCGNEAGHTRPAEWSVIPLDGPPETCTWPDMTAEDLGSRERIAGAAYLHWYPAETNTSLRHGWFWRDEEQHVKSAEEILDVWYRSVGGNTTFLLNLTPDRRGLVPERDAAVMRAVGEHLRATFENDLARGARVGADAVRAPAFAPAALLDGDPESAWCAPDGTETARVLLEFPAPVRFDRVLLQEAIGSLGQRVESFRVEALDGASGTWTTVGEGTTVGHKRILRVPETTCDALRIDITGARVTATLSEVGLYLSR